MINDLTKKLIRKIVEKEIEKNNGIIRLEPAWVARSFLPPGKRLGLEEKDYYVSERGWISERWLASVTLADNAIGPDGIIQRVKKVSNLIDKYSVYKNRS